MEKEVIIDWFLFLCEQFTLTHLRRRWIFDFVINYHRYEDVEEEEVLLIEAANEDASTIRQLKLDKLHLEARLAEWERDHGTSKSTCTIFQIIITHRRTKRLFQILSTSQFSLYYFFVVPQVTNRIPLESHRIRLAHSVFRTWIRPRGRTFICAIIHSRRLRD